MLVKNKKNNTTVNLDKFNYICASGKSVEAGIDDVSTIQIALCETGTGACALEDAISDAWCTGASFFVVSNWCNEHNVGLK